VTIEEPLKESEMGQRREHRGCRTHQRITTPFSGINDAQATNGANDVEGHQYHGGKVSYHTRIEGLSRPECVPNDAHGDRSKNEAKQTPKGVVENIMVGHRQVCAQ